MCLCLLHPTQQPPLYCRQAYVGWQNDIAREEKEGQREREREDQKPRVGLTSRTLDSWWRQTRLSHTHTHTQLPATSRPRIHTHPPPLLASTPPSKTPCRSLFPLPLHSSTASPHPSPPGSTESSIESQTPPSPLVLLVHTCKITEDYPPNNNNGNNNITTEPALRGKKCEFVPMQCLCFCLASSVVKKSLKKQTKIQVRNYNVETQLTDIHCRDVFKPGSVVRSKLDK